MEQRHRGGAARQEMAGEGGRVCEKHAEIILRELQLREDLSPSPN